jgi:LPXTG-motif cell wall-anchored protein
MPFVASTSPSPTFPFLTLPATGSGDAVGSTLLGGLVALAAGATALAFTRRRRPGL